MIGRRLPLLDGERIPDGPWEPGDYCGPTGAYTAGRPSVFFVPPDPPKWSDGRPVLYPLHVCSPPHVFRECLDGSLEIRESIKSSNGAAGWVWHGYLDEGHSWRTV